MMDMELTSDQARRITDQIKVAVEGAWMLIREAYESRAWAVLGYSSWDDYCTREFGTSRLKLPREERSEVVQSLRDAGLSIRGIESATGLGYGTVRRSLSGEPNGSPESAGNARVVGLDGKSYPVAVTRRPVPGEMFDDGSGDQRVIDKVEPIDGGQIILYDEAGECAIVTDPEADTEEDDDLPQPTPIRPAIIKPDLGGGISHPARFSDGMLEVFAELLTEHHRILDPFGGTGRIHELAAYGHQVDAIEIEPEWAALHPGTTLGSALELPWDAETFDAICTSPTYGNRLADSYNSIDPHLRRSYRFDLGRELSDNNSGGMQWGPRYRAFHEDTWAEAVRVLKPGGRFVLNIKDHYRDGKWQDVAGWHIGALQDLGLYVVSCRPFLVSNLQQGTNRERVPAELVVTLDKFDAEEGAA